MYLPGLPQYVGSVFLPKNSAMTEMIALAEQRLLRPGGIATTDLDRVFARLMTPAVDAADLYFQHTRSESWLLEDGIVKDGSHSIEQGVGVRAQSGEKTGFAYSDDIVMPALLEAAGSARAIAREGANGNGRPLALTSTRALYPAIDPIDSLSSEAKVRLLVKSMPMRARSMRRVKEVIVSVSATVEPCCSPLLMGHSRPMCGRGSLQCPVMSNRNGRRESGGSGGGGRHDLVELLKWPRATHRREAVRGGLVNLDAVEAPAGNMTVCVGPGGLSCCTRQSGTVSRAISTARAPRRFPEAWASAWRPRRDIVDDGTLAGRRGSLSVDDEGTPSQCTVLVEDGIMRGLIQDKFNARLMGMKPTGNGRRESFAHLPMPRMTNTYMQAGDKDPAEILRSVKRGLYAVNFGGGQVDIQRQIVFSAARLHAEDGKHPHGQGGKPDRCRPEVIKRGSR